MQRVGSLLFEQALIAWLGLISEMQVSVEAYYNAIKPYFAGEDLLGDWTIRTQWQVRFPK